MPAWDPGAGPMIYNPISQAQSVSPLTQLQMGGQLQQQLAQQANQFQLQQGAQQAGFQNQMLQSSLANQMAQANLAAATQRQGFGSQQNIAQTQAQAAMYPAQLQQQRFNTIFPMFQNFFGGITGGGQGALSQALWGSPGGQGGPPGGGPPAAGGPPPRGAPYQAPNHGPMQGPGGTGNSLVAPGGNNLNWSLNPSAFKGLPQGANAGYGQGGLETTGSQPGPHLPVNSQVLAGMLSAQAHGGGGAGGGATPTGSGTGGGGSSPPAGGAWGTGGFGQGAPPGAGQPRISARPVYTQGDIQRQVNMQTAANDQGTATKMRDMQSSLAGRGFGSNSPLAQALGQGMQMGNLATNTQNASQTRLGAASANAQQVLAGQTAQEQQYASRQQEAIQRAGIYQNFLSSALAALGSSI